MPSLQPQLRRINRNDSHDFSVSAVTDSGEATRKSSRVYYDLLQLDIDLPVGGNHYLPPLSNLKAEVNDAGSVRLTWDAAEAFWCWADRSQYSYAIAQNSTTVAGFTVGFRDTNIRDRHKLNLVIGLGQRYTRMGAGTQLIEALEACAQDHEIQRMELSVMTTNSAAIELYRRHGFDIEGGKRISVRLKTGLMDEFMIGKLLVG